MSDWDDLLATEPGTYVEIGAEAWMVLRRSSTRDGDLLNGVGQEHLSVAVELVRIVEEEAR